MATAESSGVFHIHKARGQVREGLPHARHARPPRRHRVGARALRHQGHRVERRRGAALLRQRALRHRARAQRQSHEHPRADDRALPQGSPPPQHQQRHRAAREHPRLRAAVRDHRSRPRSGAGLPGRRPRARTRRGFVRLHRPHRGIRSSRIPRPLRHPAPHPRQAPRRAGAGRRGARRVHRGVRVARARERGLRGRSRRAARRGGVHHPRRNAPLAAVRREPDARPPRSSTSTSRVPTRS